MNTSSDILIIGGGIMGLSLAVELKLRGATVTVLTRDFKEAAAVAAAGMLAPQAEKIPPSPMLDLCLRSRAMYPDWTRKLEQITGLETGYWPCGILAPVYSSEEQGCRGALVQRCRGALVQHLRERDKGEGRARGRGTSQRDEGESDGKTFPLSPSPFPLSPSPFPTPCVPNPQTLSIWLDKEAINQHQPELGSEVIGGWFYPEDAQVDNRSLTQTLWVAAQQLGITICEGVAVEEFVSHRQISCVKTSVGNWQAEHYVLATGAWSNELLPVPVYPKKGQMLSVHSREATPKLKQVLFGSEIYIVPRQDGRIVIGATSEDVGFTPNNTPAGIQALLTRAIRLYPELQNFPIQEFWWGFRPATPDELPILGASPYDNLTLATGHYRNGILLAPVTAFLMADLILNRQLDPLLESFSWQRFSN